MYMCSKGTFCSNPLLALALQQTRQINNNFSTARDIQELNMSSSNWTGVTELCKGTLSPCSAFTFEMTAIVINSVSILTNILHLIVLRKIKISNIQGAAYLRIIEIMSVADIISSITAMTRTLCGLRLLYYHHSLLLTAVSSTLFDAPAMWRFYVLVVATADRYTAVCHPHRYKRSIITTRTTATCLLLFAACICILAIRDIILFDNLCLDTVLGPSSTLRSTWASIFNSAVGLIPLVLVAVLSILLIKELYRMRNRAMDNQQQSITNAAKYVLIVNTLYFTCLIPILVWIICQTYFPNDDHSIFSWVSYDLFAAYGIVNSMLFLWVSKSYRQTAAGLICCVAARARELESADNQLQNLDA